MKIVSTLPTATEIVCSLGLTKELVGVSHECIYPKEVLIKPRVSSTDIDYSSASSRVIDAHVEKKMHEHASLYSLDKKLLTSLAPTHLITQMLCDVCAITPEDVNVVIRDLPNKPELIVLNPTNLKEILEDILRVGKTLERKVEAQKLVEKLRTKVEDFRSQTSHLEKPRVFCLEWLDPLFASGHWVPEMVDVAGGEEVLGIAGRPSRKVPWEALLDKNPETITMMPCGFPVEKTKAEIRSLKFQGWDTLTAVQTGQVWIVDGPSFFNQSGPRVIDKGLEILAKILHPEVFGSPNQTEALKLPEKVSLPL